MSTIKTTNGKTAAFVAYLLFFIGVIVAFFINFDDKNKFAYFHIRQALGLNFTFFIIAYFVGYFDSWMISGAFYIFFIMLWFYGFTSALGGTMKPVPLLGKHYQKLFNMIGENA